MTNIDNIKPIEINCIDDYLNEIKKLSKKNSLFRGMSNIEYDLIPTIGRE